MLINTTCPSCQSNIEPRFYVQYYDCNPRPPIPSTTALIKNFHLLLTYYNPTAQQITYGQMYDFSCFCTVANKNNSWQITRDNRYGALASSLQFPTFDPSHPQNFPRTHFSSERFNLINNKLRALQQKIENKRFNTQQTTISWIAYQTELATFWKDLIQVMRNDVTTSIPADTATIFHPGSLQLLDLRLIRNIIVITVPFKGMIVLPDQPSRKLLEGTL